MVVYAEYAFLENFLLDGLMLYLALICARGRVRVCNLFIASALGAAEALAFPVLPLPVWAAYLVKALGGILIAVVAVSKGTRRHYVFVPLFFFLFTFALGGLLTAAYTFFGVEYAEGSGYLVEQAPAGLVLGCAGGFCVLVIAASRRLMRHYKLLKSVFDCTLTAGGKTVRWKGFADSGNCLTFRGKPVGVVSAAAVFALFGARPREAGRIKIGTVNGEREAPVFVCDSLELGGRVYRDACLAVGEVPNKHYQIILHTAWTEACHEADGTVETSHQNVEKRGKRRPLPLRK